MALSTDTLQVNQEVLGRFLQNPDYDYGREITGVSSVDAGEFWSRLWKRILELLPDIKSSFDVGNTSPVIVIIEIVILVAFLALLIVMIVRYIDWSKWTSGKSSGLEYEVSDDTIYGIDFDANIQKALEKDDYLNAVRFVYLKTLKELDDRRLIDWKIFKTPEQYAHEFSHDEFRKETILFMRIRYGCYPADESDYQMMKKYMDSVYDGLKNRKGGMA